MDQALQYFKSLGGFASGDGNEFYLARYLDLKITLLLILGSILATPVSAKLNRFALGMIEQLQGTRQTRMGLSYACINLFVLGTLLSLCVMAIAASAYSPFIYFRF